MKNIMLYSFASMLLLSVPVQAARPTDINYLSKKVTTFGTEYREYAVRCSDGTRELITAWGKRASKDAKWCVGTSKQCSKTQLGAAKLACSEAPAK